MKLLQSIWIILKTRPLHIPTLFRSKLLFWMVFIFRKLRIVHYPNVKFGKNIRLQTLLGLKAECPNALIIIEDDCIIYEKARLEAYGCGQIKIGSQSILGDVVIYSRNKVNLGRRVLVAWNVMIQDFNPHPTSTTQRRRQVEQMIEQFSPQFSKQTTLPQRIFQNDFESEEIFIGDDVWLGANCIILKGAQIGEGSIVAAGAVVFKGTYPAKSILMGNPARVVKTTED